MHLSLSTALRSASRCSRPLSTPYGGNASFALGARLSCSHVLFGGLWPSPSFQLPTVLGCLAPLALVAAPLTREAAASTAARNVGISVGVGDGDVGDGGASGVRGVGDGGACVGGIGSACGAGGVCDGGACVGGIGSACGAGGVCDGGVATVSHAAYAAASVAAQADSLLPAARWSLSLSQTSSSPPLRSGLGTSTSSPYLFGVSRCSAVYSPRPQCVVRSRSSPLMQPRAVRRPLALS